MLSNSQCTSLAPYPHSVSAAMLACQPLALLQHPSPGYPPRAELRRVAPPISARHHGTEPERVCTPLLRMKPQSPRTDHTIQVHATVAATAHPNSIRFPTSHHLNSTPPMWAGRHQKFSRPRPRRTS